MKMTRLGILSALGLVGVVATAQAMTSIAFSTRAGGTSPTVCASGTSQDLSCLEAKGAISPDGTVNDKLAELAKGHCPCLDGGVGVTVSTIPASSTDDQLGLFANQQAAAAWGYRTVLVQAYDGQGKPIGDSTTFLVGTKGAGFAVLRAAIKNLVVARRQAGAVSFKFLTGRPRN